MSTQHHSSIGDDTMNTGDSEQLAESINTDDLPENGSPDPEDTSAAQEATISGLQAAADEFNAAFSTALYELESARRQAREYAARIDDLNESVSIFSAKLHDAKDKSRTREEEYSRKSEHLNQIIQDLESERNHLQQQTSEQENTLNERAGEIEHLSTHINELNSRLEQHQSEAQQAVEAHQREAEQLNQRIHEIEHAREQLRQQASEQENALNERAGEIERLSAHINELNSRLEQHQSEAQQAVEAHQHEAEQLNQRIHEIEHEREQLRQQSVEQQDILNARAEEIGQLTARRDELISELEQIRTQAAESEMEFSREREALQGDLEARSNEIAGLSDQIETQSAEIVSLTDAGTQREQAHQEDVERLNGEIGNLNESLQAAELLHQQQINELGTKNSEIQWLNDHVSELDDHISELAGSLRKEADEHAGERDRLNVEITNIATELETAQSNINDISAHAEKLENLNRALHESSISENELHRKLLEEKNAAIATLREQMDPANDAAAEIQIRQASEIQDLQTALHQIESRLKDSESRGESLAERAALADELEKRVAELDTALQETRDSADRDSIDIENLKSMQARVADLESALASARTDNENLSFRLQEYQALEQEVESLRESASQSDNAPLDHADEEKINALTEELEKLRSELTASEARCEELVAELSNVTEPGTTCTENSSAAGADTASTGITTDRNRLMLHLDDLLTEHDDSGVQHSVMYVLLDNFIRIREEIGVMNSEHILTQALQIVDAACDENDMLARIGDCTFAILCKDASTGETQDKAESICSTIEQHIFEVDERSIVVTASIGIDAIRSSDTSAEEVVSRADKACEAARSSGGNQVLVNSNVTDETLIQGNSDDHAGMISDILSDNRIKIHYQPISPLSDTNCNFYEVLTRIVDENGDIILPGEFFSMAVNSGKAMDVDFHVIESIMSMLAGNPDRSMKLFIKLSSQSVSDPEFPIWVLNKIKEYQINPKQLALEVSEAVLNSDLKNIAMLSKALENVGCSLAIEHYRLDAGPQHLQHIKADYIKIDSGLIQNISNKSDCLAKVREIVNFSRQHNFLTVAEGVESPASLSILYELGIDYAQGYFIQAPSGDIEYQVEEIVTEDDSVGNQKAVFRIG